MVKFSVKPPSPIFSKVFFPSHEEFLSKDIRLGYNAINDTTGQQFHVWIEYNLLDVTGTPVAQVVNCQMNFDVIKSQGEKVTVEHLMQASQDSIDELTKFLSPLPNVEKRLLQVDDVELELNRRVLEQMVILLNR